MWSLFALVSVQRIVYGEWKSISHANIPKSINPNVIGHRNGLIHILSADHKEITQYNIANGKFPGKGSAVDYSQIDNMLYTIGDDGQSIEVYDLVNQTDEILNVIPNTVGKDASIATSTSLTPRLYITGGDTLDALQIYDIETEKWIQNLPSMLNQRRDHGSIVVDGMLYVIGGEGLDSIEAIDIMDIEGALWKEIGSLPKVIHSFGTVEMDGIIYIVGGQGNDGELLDSVYMFDTLTNLITLHDDRLPFTIRNPRVIMVNETLYVFGEGQMAKLDISKDDGMNHQNGRKLLSVAPTGQPTAMAPVGKMGAPAEPAELASESDHGSGHAMEQEAETEAETESKEWYIIIPVLATSAVLILFCVGQCLCKRAVLQKQQSIEAPEASMDNVEIVDAADGPTATSATGTTQVVIR